VSDRKIGSSGVYLSDNVEKRFKTGDDGDEVCGCSYNSEKGPAHIPDFVALSTKLRKLT
jgi:hypothetical protein